MSIDSRVTNGLAWAGVLLVVGIPAADLVSAQFMGDRAQAAPAQIAVIGPGAPVPAPLSQRPAAPVAPAVQSTVKLTVPAVVPSVAKTADAVDHYLQSGKDLPSYIADAPRPAPVAAIPPAQPQVTVPTATVMSAASAVPTDPVQVASIPARVAPTPMPLSMRPRPVIVPVVAVPPSNDLVVPPSSSGPISPANVTAQDLEDWETGPLSDFLARRRRQQPQQAGVDSLHDTDGFFFDEGPNRPRRSDRLIGPASRLFFPFTN